MCSTISSAACQYSGRAATFFAESTYLRLSKGRASHFFFLSFFFSLEVGLEVPRGLLGFCYPAFLALASFFVCSLIAAIACSVTNFMLRSIMAFLSLLLGTFTCSFCGSYSLRAGTYNYICTAASTCSSYMASSMSLSGTW